MVVTRDLIALYEHIYIFAICCSIRPNNLEIVMIQTLAGMYTQFLVEHLAEPDLAIRKMLDMVARAVVEHSGGKQIPVCAHQTPHTICI